MRLTARMCWALDGRPGVLIAMDLVGAALFVAGCVVFYFPARYATGVTLFLLGSVLMLIAASGRAFLIYGPSE